MAYVPIEIEENDEEIDNWISTLVEKTKDIGLGFKKITFKISSSHWDEKNNEIIIPREKILLQIHTLRDLGAINIGVYPGFHEENCLSLQYD